MTSNAAKNSSSTRPDRRSTIGPTTWHKIKEVFGLVFEKNRVEREASLQEACRGDDFVRAQVESLLCSENTGAEDSAPEDRMIGRRLGAYEIIKPLGYGGMAAVYLALRADQQFRKRVAVKIIHPGSETAGLVSRFRNERQTLAALDHSNIVKLLDGGMSDEGSPYLVMDYVEGLTIDEYCDHQKLSIEERLRLFLKVCVAVQHAHESRIIHRDLKPGNILVTAEGIPKLLDLARPTFCHTRLETTGIMPREQRLPLPPISSGSSANFLKARFLHFSNALSVRKKLRFSAANFS